MKRKAYAKINLGLDVLGVRPDGYHEVRTVMQTISLHDLVILEKRDDPGIRLTTSHRALPNDADNIAYRAAALLLPEGAGVGIHIEKHIPIAAGMAGGSTNAAAVLHGMNRLFSLGYTLQALQKLGVKLGADVPYCLQGGTMYGGGIGEELTPLAAMPNCFILTANPGYSVSTRAIYDAMDGTDPHPDITGIIDGLNRHDIGRIADRLGNSMETVTVRMHPDLQRMKEIMIRAGALGALMSGSGPTVFGIFDRRSRASEAARILQEEHLARTTYISVPVNRESQP